MKKLSVIVLAILLASCSSNYMEDYTEQSKQVEIVNYDEYLTMRTFVQDLCDSELFGFSMPSNPTYKDLMNMAAYAILTDVWGDTFGEGDCLKVYSLVLDYFKANDPDARIVSYLDYIITNELY